MSRRSPAKRDEGGLMNKHHQEIIGLFSSYKSNYSSKHDNSYIGSKKISYPINTPTSRKLIKDWLKKIEFTPETYRSLLDSLSRGKSHNEFSAIGKLLEFCPKLRHSLNPSILNSWLDRAEGWAEVDTICQGNFSAKELLTCWLRWQKLITKFVKDKNVHKRRASLVLLTAPVRHSPDRRLSNLAFENIDKLKSEKDILITKAISWLLRDLIRYHRHEVESYLKKNSNILPKIAIRETTNKLKTGRKSGK